MIRENATKPNNENLVLYNPASAKGMEGILSTLSNLFETLVERQQLESFLNQTDKIGEHVRIKKEKDEVLVFLPWEEEAVAGIKLCG